MNICPHCGGNLGDLDHVMDVLAATRPDGRTTFKAACCEKDVEAFSDTSQYYIVDETRAPLQRQFIGAA